ncbi:MAG: GNAT family N-acetyltransferase [Candidatus Coprovivens sp.]
MVIQKATKEDFLGIHKIFQEVHDHHLNGTINTFKDIDPFTKEELLESLKDKNTFILIAKEKEIEGFILATIIEKEGRHTKLKKTLHINTIGTKKDSQNKGIGTLLINEIKKIAKENKCDNINLSVWAFNDNAIKFYKHIGFNNKIINMEITL